MGLRETAELDLGTIINDGQTGFGWPIAITDPTGFSAELSGFSNDIEQILDPDTGQAVTGRVATATIRITDLTTAGLGIPEAIADESKKPWIIEFDDINLNPYKFKVQKSLPDRALGLVVCVLELYS